MRKCLIFAICLGLLSAFAMNASAVESLVDDFDDGTDPGYWGGNIWNGGTNQDGTNGYTNVAYIGPSGQSFGIGWSGIDTGGEWIGGGENLAAGSGDAGVDISTYTTLSFWIYTPNSNTKIDVELKAPADVQKAKLHLQDYLITGTSVWQEVCIPLQAFVRQNPNLDLSTATSVNIVGEYDQGSVDVDGQVYIDNIRFTIQERAPANSTIFSGANKGASGEADVAGDTLLWWDEAASTVTCNEVQVKVSTGYDISWVSPPDDKTSLSVGATAYFAYKVRNDGNIGDRIVFSTEAVTGFSCQWPARVYWDKDASGGYSAGDVEHWDSIGLCPDSTFYFLLAVNVPDDAADLSSASVRTYAKDANGSGANDGWGTTGDTINDEVIAKVNAPVITVVKSTSVASGQPGDSVEYYIKITNSGSQAATNLQLVDVVPFYTHLTADATGCLSDDSLAPTIEYWDGSSWGAGYTDKSKVKWAWSSIGNGLTAYCTFYVDIE